ncbi:MAG: cbb3-type cytochrome oxidase assembly protein CcoS [Desulfuromonas sp.]|nr:MAG: cbb3-type cytochrome oxidase assembly protein CcoS [Desulfuromonas sp.]
MFKSLVILIVLSLLIGTGVWLFFIWAVKKGEFDDIEAPKYRMLDDDAPQGDPPCSKDP